MVIKRFLIMLLICLYAPANVFAITSAENEIDSRSIYVGDIITLKITSHGYSVDLLEDKFRDFEILEIREIKNEPGCFTVSLRSFEVGEWKISIGNKEININIRSTLDDIEREDIFEGNAALMEPGFTIKWRIPLYVAAGIFLLSGCFVLFNLITKKRSVITDPYILFLRHTGALKVEDDDYFVSLTYYFKKYIESLHQCRIIGKTSNEIIAELNSLSNIDALHDSLPTIREWMLECDRMKFTGLDVSAASKNAHYEKLIKIAELLSLSGNDFYL